MQFCTRCSGWPTKSFKFKRVIALIWLSLMVAGCGSVTNSPANTTTAAANPNPTPGVSATFGVGARPTIGNPYPAGPAPTAAPPAGGLQTVALQIPDQFKKGNFSQPRSLQLPPGFKISVYSILDEAVRFGTISPDGRLFVSEMDGGRIMVLSLTGTTGDAQVFASGLNKPHGLAFHQIGNQTYLYVAEGDKISRFSYANGQKSSDNKEVVVNNIPSGGQHSTRSLAFGPTGKLYVAAGSDCNVCEESDPRRAAVTQYNADGSGEHIFAKGLRNEVGLAFYPTTGELWGTENGRDEIGNDIPPEEINILQDGNDYGWPYCYSNQVFDTQGAGQNAAYCQHTIPPALPMQAHSAPLGLDFYFPQTPQFPTDFQGDAFIAFHGSWNRTPPTGYKVVRVRVRDGRPATYEDFATGWLTNDGSAWGRPVDPIVAPDGSLFVTDDSNNAIYHISYSK